jgi:hypothetical protein
MAMRMDSVPPDVSTPQASGPPLNRFTTICTISASILRAIGNTSGCSVLAMAKRLYAAEAE